MRTFRDRVIILKSKDYKESDKLLTVFSRERGKFTLIARGIRKLESKNRGNLQTLSVADISYYQAQGLPLLMESKAITIPDFTSINIRNTQRVLSLIHKFLAEEEKYPKVFAAVSSAIKKDLDNESTNRFRLILLMEEGLVDSFSSCSMCGGSEDLEYIKLSSFVLVCNTCYSNNQWSQSDIMKLDKDIYSSGKFTLALDKYIDNILLNLV